MNADAGTPPCLERTITNAGDNTTGAAHSTENYQHALHWVMCAPCTHGKPGAKGKERRRGSGRNRMGVGVQVAGGDRQQLCHMPHQG